MRRKHHRNSSFAAMLGQERLSPSAPRPPPSHSPHPNHWAAPTTYHHLRGMVPLLLSPPTQNRRFSAYDAQISFRWISVSYATTYSRLFYIWLYCHWGYIFIFFEVHTQFLAHSSFVYRIFGLFCSRHFMYARTIGKRCIVRKPY